MSCYIGLDVGSVSADFVVANEKGRVLDSSYIRTFGQPLPIVLEQLKALEQKHEVNGVCVTGSGAKIVAELLDVPFINEIVAQSKATMELHPEVRTIMEIGGEDSKLIRLEPGDDGSPRVVDFALNSMCSAGTGSFLDQQASRLLVSIEEFAELALKSDHPARVAGRCSVFAKSDMIHLQQQGTPDYDIIAGLCFAMARNFRSTLGKGKDFVHPIAFQGGVAFNPGMKRAFQEVLELEDDEFIIPENPGCTGAYGAILDTLEKGLDCSFSDFRAIEQHMDEYTHEAERLDQLVDDGYETDTSCHNIPDQNELTEVYVGVDIGSISTNAVVIDPNMNVISRCYLMTEGRPIEAVKKALYQVGQEIGDKVEVKGACTTGSGRYLIAEFIGADLVKNEITTHARGAIAMDPEVDTIFEIGGQDAKYISLQDGAVVDFAMNKVCAAGTGSFLEEQAERLDLKIEEEFGKTALSSKQPVKLGERCTVFMESDLNYHQQRGISTPDLVGGLCYSIVYNYLNRVVEDRKVGENIFFQGGVAFNRGVKAAFEQISGKKITVPPHQ
ncbi:MAG: CoA activase, partial [Planctomycetes bacterium]|nr:CoA activase [Planctomycetota bacterium]